MRPSSVCMPVAVTTACASPPVQAVPLNTRSRACSSGPVGVGWLGGAGRRQRFAGQRGQVDLDAPSMRRASAQMRSPSAITSTSPGTRVRASTSTAAVAHARWPGRAGRRPAPRRPVRPAAPGRTRTARSTRSPRRSPPPAPACPSTRPTRPPPRAPASGWVNCFSSSPGHRRPELRGSSLGPYTSSRRCASRPDNPNADVRRSRNNRLRGSLESVLVGDPPSSRVSLVMYRPATLWVAGHLAPRRQMRDPVRRPEGRVCNGRAFTGASLVDAGRLYLGRGRSLRAAGQRDPRGHVRSPIPDRLCLSDNRTGAGRQLRNRPSTFRPNAIQPWPECGRLFP